MPDINRTAEWVTQRLEEVGSATNEGAALIISSAQLASKGSATRGVYFDAAGAANQMTHTLNADVPSGAVFSYASFSATCSTAANQQVKVATIEDTTGWEFRAGVMVGVKFTNTNSFVATNTAPIQLNVNGTGAKNIFYGGTATPTGNNTTAFGRTNYTNYYMYDGTYWVWAGTSSDNNTTYSNMSQTEATTGTATTARTISAKVLNTTIDGKINKITALITANTSKSFNISRSYSGVLHIWGSTAARCGEYIIFSNANSDVISYATVKESADMTITKGDLLLTITPTSDRFVSLETSRGTASE